MPASKRFGHYRKRVGVDEREQGRRQSNIDFHSLRRWFITKARNAGIDRATSGRLVVNNTEITRKQGLSGSVMDYNPVNLAPKGVKQGDYFSTTIGPYDYGAIEYAYKPVDGDEAAELKKIGARSPDPDLAYATDEDMFLDNDPYVNTYDLGSDTLCYARARIALAGDLLKDLDAKVVNDGEAWTRLRTAFSVLLAQWGNGAYLAAEHIGGQSVTRDHKGDKGARDPIVPVKAVEPCDPPFVIFRLDYVDLCAWSDSDDRYQAGLRRLLEAIDGKRTIREMLTGEVERDAARSMFERLWWHDQVVFDAAPRD